MFPSSEVSLLMSSERAPRSPGGETGRGPGAGAPAGGSASGTAALEGRNPNPHPGIGRLGWMVRGLQGPGRRGYPVPGSGSGGARPGRRIERSGSARLRSCGRDSAGSIQASGRRMRRASWVRGRGRNKRRREREGMNMRRNLVFHIWPF